MPAAVGTVAIRPLLLEDVTPAYVGWLNDPEVTRFLVAGRTPQTAASIRAFVGTVAKPFAIEHDGAFVGTICLRVIDRESQVAEVGVLLGHRAVWGVGVASTALALLEYHARTVLGLRKLWAGTCNPACARLFRRNGWMLEGMQIRHVYLNGAWHDHTLHGKELR